MPPKAVLCPAVPFAKLLSPATTEVSQRKRLGAVVTAGGARLLRLFLSGAQLVELELWVSAGQAMTGASWQGEALEATAWSSDSCSSTSTITVCDCCDLLVDYRSLGQLQVETAGLLLGVSSL